MRTRKTNFIRTARRVSRDRYQMYVTLPMREFQEWELLLVKKLKVEELAE